MSDWEEEEEVEEEQSEGEKGEEEEEEEDEEEDEGRVEIFLSSLIIKLSLHILFPSNLSPKFDTLQHTNVSFLWRSYFIHEYNQEDSISSDPEASLSDVQWMVVVMMASSYVLRSI